MKTVEPYKIRLGYYPKEVLIDKIYCTRQRPSKLKTPRKTLVAKPLRRLLVLKNHVRPCERNPIEGKFGQAKIAYRMNCINKASTYK